MGWGELDQEGGGGADFSAEGEALQQAEGEDQDGCGDADHRAGRGKRKADDGDAHEPEGEHHGGFAAATISHAADDQGPDGAGEEAGSEGGEGGEEGVSRVG